MLIGETNDVNDIFIIERSKMKMEIILLIHCDYENRIDNL